jgi:hypothetical protein
LDSDSIKCWYWYSTIIITIELISVIIRLKWADESACPSKILSRSNLTSRYHSCQCNKWLYSSFTCCNIHHILAIISSFLWAIFGWIEIPNGIIVQCNQCENKWKLVLVTQILWRLVKFAFIQVEMIFWGYIFQLFLSKLNKWWNWLDDDAVSIM